MAGRVADGVLRTSCCTVPYVRWAVERIRRSAAEANRNPDEIEIAAIIPLRISSDSATDLEALKPAAALAYAMPNRGELLLPGSGGDLEALGPMRAALRIDELLGEGRDPDVHALERVRSENVSATVPTRLAEPAVIVGTAEQCRTRLQGNFAAGVRHAIIDSPQPADMLHGAVTGPEAAVGAEPASAWPSACEGIAAERSDRAPSAPDLTGAPSHPFAARLHDFLSPDCDRFSDERCPLSRKFSI
ncbi:MAG: LLM class flavin-dependent oxidoreductase [Thermomicrobiales bacterium]|nr:LLM class flavin-dependent oxidoreductase [Thermomicrobiales bacterium]